MQKVIVSLSGGEVIALSTPDEVDVEVRQYHRDYVDPDELRDDPETGGRYAVIARAPRSGAPTVEAIAEYLRRAAGARGWSPSFAEEDHNGPPMDTSDYDGRALAFLMDDVDGYQIRVVVEDVTPDDRLEDR
jgi:hypothetical protein